MVMVRAGTKDVVVRTRRSLGTALQVRSSGSTCRRDRDDEAEKDGHLQRELRFLAVVGWQRAFRMLGMR